VRTMATVALTQLEDESRLPEDFWTTTTHLALASACVAPRLGIRTQDALCVGLLAELGSALLHQTDPLGYGPIARDAPGFATRRAWERRRYGISTLELSALALDRWSFPIAVIEPMQKVEATGAIEGAVLRVGYEVVSRLLRREHDPQAVVRLSCGRLDERSLAPALRQVEQEADELRRAVFGD